MRYNPDRQMLDDNVVFGQMPTGSAMQIPTSTAASTLQYQTPSDITGASADIVPTEEFDATVVQPEVGKSKTVVSTYTDSNTGDTVAVYSDGSTAILARGTIQQDANAKLAAEAAAKKAQGQSAWDIMYNEFAKMGLGNLVMPLQKLIERGASGAEMVMELRKTPEYAQRFPANAARIANGYAAIDEAAYLQKENAYQQKMQQYGLPAQYWKKNSLGTNDAYTQLLANDVPVTELEDRLIAGKQIINSTTGTLQAIKDWYPEITDGEILAYVLNPKQAIKDIQRKVALGQLGGEAIAQGLSTSQQRAEELYNAGVTAERYQAAAPFISEASLRGSQLASFYGQGPYDQTTAEQEALGLAGATEAAKKRKKITGLEQAEWSGSSGVGALGRERPSYQAQTFGAGAY